MNIPSERFSTSTQVHVDTTVTLLTPMDFPAYTVLDQWPADQIKAHKDMAHLHGFLVQKTVNGISCGPAHWTAALEDLGTHRTTDLAFSEALTMLQCGLPMARAGWNGTSMFAVLVLAHEWDTLVNQHVLCGEIKGAMLPWIGLSTAQGDFVPWQPSQSDLLSRDWLVAIKSDAAAIIAAADASVAVFVKTEPPTDTAADRPSAKLHVLKPRVGATHDATMSSLDVGTARTELAQPHEQQQFLDNQSILPPGE